MSRRRVWTLRMFVKWKNKTPKLISTMLRIWISPMRTRKTSTAITMQYSIIRTYQGVTGYNYNNNPKPIAPFENRNQKSWAQTGWSWWKISISIRSRMPSTSVASLDRSYSETALRNNTETPYTLPPTYVKSFTMRRDYNSIGTLPNHSSSISMQYKCSNWRTGGRIDTQEERDSIRTNLLRLGHWKITIRHQSATYNVPFSKFPATDFITGSIRYDAKYNWTAAPLYYNDSLKQFVENSWGNTIGNSQGWTYNASITFTNLYNKIPYLKRINSPTPPKPVAPETETRSNTGYKDYQIKEWNWKCLALIARGVSKRWWCWRTLQWNYTVSNGTTAGLPW